ncbi:MAG: hypothetical protein DRP86_01155 [Candidatus Neomarinimicrobiota bacterium]|nr:MAG: hypothetical protein DRP86_01155 [Candidatus Neomarinimicrobiota bacterium]
MTVDTPPVNNACFLFGTHLYCIVDMKKLHLKYIPRMAVILLMAWSAAFAWDGIGNFDAYVQNGKIVVEWQTKHEDNVDYFVIQRSMNSNDSYYDLAKIEPHGNGWAYIYIDEKILGKSANMVYNYRLKIVFRDKSIAYSDQSVQVVMVVSSLQHTWGSIKAMFQ